MKLQNLAKRINEPVTVALGFFDCVHLGHRRLLTSARKLADALNSKLAVLSFVNNPDGLFSNNNKVINVFSERAQLLSEAGADYVLYTVFDKEFSEKTADEFLNILSENDIRGIVCGFDYRFGKNASGNTDLLEKFCKLKNIAFEVQPQICFKNKKLSTTLVKEFLSNGDMASVAECLGRNYFLEGYVGAGRGVGKKLGFPTANIEIEPEKMLPKKGVYGGTAEFDSKIYKCVINVGGRPTFNDSVDSVEVHIIDFDGDLYFKKIKVSFSTYLRPVTKFDSEQALISQIGENVRKIKND